MISPVQHPIRAIRADGRSPYLGELDHKHESLLRVRPEQLLPQLVDRLDTGHQIHSRRTVLYGHGARLQGLELSGRFEVMTLLPVHESVLIRRVTLHNTSITWSTCTALSTLS